MLLGLISILILILLGILNAGAFVGAKHPALKQLVDKTTPFENYIGLAGIVLGILTVLNSLSYFHGIYGLVTLFAGFLTLALGLLSSSSFLKEQVFKGNISLQEKIDQATAKLITYQQAMGLTGIVLGVLYLLLMLGAY